MDNIREMGGYLLLDDFLFLREEGLALGVALIDHSGDLGIDHLVGLLRVTLLVALLLGIVESAESRTHPVLGDEAACDLCAFLQVVRRACGYLTEKELFRDSATQSHDDHVL